MPETTDQPEDQPEKYTRESKSQRKRDAHALQQLGARLVAARPAQTAALPLAEALHDAIVMARGIRSHGAMRRQLQLIGKLMREADADAISAALDQDARHDKAGVARMHAAERWRERLLEDQDALVQWRERFGEESGARVAELLPAAQAELTRGERGRRYRELFRHLRAVLEEQAESGEQSEKQP